MYLIIHIHTFIHTYFIIHIRTHLLLYIHTYIYTYIHAYIYTCPLNTKHAQEVDTFFGHGIWKHNMQKKVKWAKSSDTMHYHCVPGCTIQAIICIHLLQTQQAQGGDTIFLKYNTESLHVEIRRTEPNIRKPYRNFAREAIQKLIMHTHPPNTASPGRRYLFQHGEPACGKQTN